MKFLKVKTRTFLPPKDNLYQLLDTSLPRLTEGDVLLIASKLLAIHQGRCVPVTDADKRSLIKKEADRYIPGRVFRNAVPMTIKGNTIIPFSGIDESNGNGYYILWPKNPAALTEELCRYLKKKFRIKKLAVIATDSHPTPLRYGVLGISIGFYGLEPLYDYRGQRDIFGRKLRFTRTNIVDALSAMAVLLMGEGKERTPMVIVRGAKFVRFTNRVTHKKLAIPIKEDAYGPLLKMFKKY